MKILCISPFSPSAPNLYGRILPLLYELPKDFEAHIVFSSRYTPRYSKLLLPFQDRLKFTFLSYSTDPSFSSSRSSESSHLTSSLKDILREISFFKIGRFLPPLTALSDLKTFSHLVLTLNNDFDLIYISKPWLQSAGVGIWLSKIWNIPVFLDLDDHDVHPQNVLLRKFRGIVVASHELKRKFKQYDPCYVPNSTNPSKFDPSKYGKTSTGKGNPVLIWSGIMYGYLRLELILKAFSLLKREATLIFVGDGDKKPVLESMIKPLKLEEKVMFKGWIDHVRVPEVLANCDVGILHLSNSEYERCKSPIKLYEYMAMKLPIITTDVGEAGYTVNRAKCGILVKHGDVKGMAEAMGYLIGDEDLRRKLGERGRKFLEREQNWKLLASRLYCFIKERLRG